MPGIVGIISPDGRLDDGQAVQAMIRSMLHEKTFSSGDYRNAELGLSAGWVSRPGSFSDCLPIWNERRDICLLFCGEDFRDETELQALRAAGHEFQAKDAG